MTYERLLEKIKILRKKRGLSLRALSKRIGISAMFLSYIERGKNALSMENFLKICDALCIEPNKLLEEEQDLSQLID